MQCASSVVPLMVSRALFGHIRPGGGTLAGQTRCWSMWRAGRLYNARWSVWQRTVLVIHRRTKSRYTILSSTERKYSIRTILSLFLDISRSASLSLSLSLSHTHTSGRRSATPYIPCSRRSPSSNGRLPRLCYRPRRTGLF